MKIIDVVLNKLINIALALVRRFLRSPQQLAFCGEGSTEQLLAHIVRAGAVNVLVVTDRPLVELGLAQRIVDGVTAQGAKVVVYDGVTPDPTVAVVEGALKVYQAESCDAVLALGGGSSIDTAKTVAAATTNGGIDSIMGLFKVKLAPAPLYAIPTTAGTGSEASWFAVISDTQTHQKNGIGAPALLPKATALDASLMLGLPKGITAATGMDALTHAIETYLATGANDEVRALSRSAVVMIFSNLQNAYEDGQNFPARESMAIASYYAGISLNTAAVGYVHAIAHQLGAKYGTPHGLANAMVLPQVLEVSMDAVSSPMAELAEAIDCCGSHDSERTAASKFVDAVRELALKLDIPLTIPDLQSADIPDLVKSAAEEGRTYGVPMVLSRPQIADILTRLLS